MFKKKVASHNQDDINQSIEDGTYYKQALNWYFTKFLRPITERLYWFFIFIVYLIAMFILYVQIKSWFPLVINRPIVLVNNDAQFKQVVSKLPNPYKNADISLLNFLLKNYVQMREEFLSGSIDLLQIDNRLKKIANNSSREVVKEYQDIFDSNDIKNPIKRLGKSGTRKITLDEVNLNIEETSLKDKIFGGGKLLKMPKSATIRYFVDETTVKKNRKELWEAKIAFNYAGVIINKENNEMVITEFKVTEYINKRLDK